MMALLGTLVRAIDRLNERVGRAATWCTLLMVLMTVVDVTLRYLFRAGSVAVQELEWHMFGFVFLLGAAYTLQRDEHVRVDIFYRRLSARRKAIVDLLGTLIFLLPVAIFLVISSWDYVQTSWVIREASREAGGLPYPFVPILKSLIPATAGMLILQGIANLMGAILTLTGRMPPRADRKIPTGDLI